MKKITFAWNAMICKISENIGIPIINMDLQLPVLNLPPFQPGIRFENGLYEIFDPIRKKWIKLSPEEWVRQSFLNHLTSNLGYPAGRIGVEIQVKYNKLSRRADAVVFDNSTKPLVIIECKSPEVKLDEDVFYQACMYNRQLRAKWLILTNGAEHIAADISGEKVIFLNEIPAFCEL